MRILPAGFIAPCLPTNSPHPPAAGDWLHEIKHDGFRVIAHKAGTRVRLYSRPGNDLTARFPLIVEGMARLRSRSCTVDGEAVACGDDGMADMAKRFQDPLAEHLETIRATLAAMPEAERAALAERARAARARVDRLNQRTPALRLFGESSKGPGSVSPRFPLEGEPSGAALGQVNQVDIPSATAPCRGARRSRRAAGHEQTKSDRHIESATPR